MTDIENFSYCPRTRAQPFRKSRPSTKAPFSCVCCFLAPEPTAATAAAPPELPLVSKLSSRVSRVLGRNPGSLSLTGTNIYLVGTGESRILIDAGEGKPGVLEDILATMAQEGCTQLEQILLTHWHGDHILGVPGLLRHFGSIPVRKFLPESSFEVMGMASKEHWGGQSVFDEIHSLVTPLTDGEVLECEGATLRVIFTPGHAVDHAAFMLEEEQALFTGDHVLGWGTGLVGDLHRYMSSLHRMRSEKPDLLYPAHGPMVDSGKAVAWIDMYISHREARIEQVFQAVSQAKPGGINLQDVARVVYADQPHVLAPSSGLWATACFNTSLVLESLVKDGKCAENNGLFSLQLSRL